jgi:hypothetical protein
VNPPAAARPGKRRLALIAAVVAVALSGLVIWAANDPGSYGRSRAGCITVTVPSSMGGALLHQCGADARATCRRARGRTDRLSVLIRPQCRLAGLG